jgi:beta-glucosidase
MLITSLRFNQRVLNAHNGSAGRRSRCFVQRYVLDITDIISRMTIEEKASLTTGKDFWQTRSIDRLGVPSLFLSDGPHGLRKQAAKADRIGLNESVPATCFPAASAVANTWNPDIARRMGEALGEEAASMNVQVLLGPGINIKRNPLCGRNFEYYSEDPYLAGKMAASCIQGIQSRNVAACVKHFAANNQEERRMVIDTIVDERTLREIYLTAFEIAVKEGKTFSLMAAYNMLNGFHAAENHHLLVDILRNEWNFGGVVISDWGGDCNRIPSIQCGLDLEMPTNAGISDIEIVHAVRTGKLDESVLDASVRRLIELGCSTTAAEHADFDKDAHHVLARKIAEESVVLLKNENNILPLKEGAKTVFIGDFVKNPRYQGAGSSMVNATKLDTAYEIIKNVPGVMYAGGYERHGKPNMKLLHEACCFAESAETVVLYLGLDETSEVEGLDRKTLALPQNQTELLAEIARVNKNIVVVLSCGCVVEMPWINSVKGVVHGYLHGQAGAGAVVDVLYGRVNPSGKLAETYPFNYSDIPSASNFPGKEVSTEYREGIYVGYRYFTTAEKDVLFPFGYGLSYTTFEYKNITAAADGVRFTITNTGRRAGSETAQLYVGKDNSLLVRAKRELKGFAKVHLEPGETKEVLIGFDDKSFRYFNVVTDRWEIEKGTYRIEIGASCTDIRLSTGYTVSGTDAPVPCDRSKLPSYYAADVLHVGDAEFSNLLGYKPVDPRWNTTKKLEYNDTLSQLSYAKGAMGRFAFHGMQFAYGFFKFTRNTLIVNTFDMSLFHMPFWGIVRMSGGVIDFPMLDGIMEMVNGKFFRGCRMFIKAKNEKTKRDKQREAAHE